MRKTTHSTVYKEESRMFYAACIFLLTMFFAYIYFVSASVADVVVRKEVDAQITAIGTKLSQLEAEYIEMQHSLSADIATHRGFVAVDEKVFIQAGGDTLVLRGN